MLGGAYGVVAAGEHQGQLDRQDKKGCRLAAGDPLVGRQCAHLPALQRQVLALAADDRADAGVHARDQ